MATFVLIHGAWGGAWYWERVTSLLTAQGHRVHVPDLTGLGDRQQAMSPDVGLSTHVNDVVTLFESEDLSDTILCGHSYGGMVVTGAADHIGARLRSLIYLDAFVPLDGQSVFDIMPPSRRQSMHQRTLPAPREWLITPLAAAAFGVNEDDRAWVDSRQVPHPLRCFDEPFVATGPAPVVPRLYVEAVGYEPRSFTAIAERLRGDPAWTVTRMSCGHFPMLDQPAETAALLIAAA